MVKPSAYRGLALSVRRYISPPPLSMMFATVLQVIFAYALTRKLEKRLLWLLLAVLVFGGATLFFRNQAFIQWKPSIFNWVLGLAFGSVPVRRRQKPDGAHPGQSATPAKTVWTRLNSDGLQTFLSWARSILVSLTNSVRRPGSATNCILRSASPCYDASNSLDDQPPSKDDSGKENSLQQDD